MLPWYLKFVINKFVSISYVYIGVISEELLESFTAIVFTVDFINVPDVSISAKLKYLLSLDTALSITELLGMYDFINWFPFWSKTIITDLYVVPEHMTDT